MNHSESQAVAPLTFRKINVLRGPNVWANFPVLEVWVELGELEYRPSDTIPGFNERVMAWLPSMIEHRCSVGERGGFFERMRRGTYMGHILEHVTLELQTLAGNEVGFGRARQVEGEFGVYRVAIEYHEEAVGKAALEAGRRLCLAAIDDLPFDVNAEVAALRDLIHEVCLGPSTRSIVNAAKQRRIPSFRLNEGNLVQLGYGSKQRRILTAETDRTSAIAEAIAQDKQLTRQLLSDAGIPVPEGQPVASAAEAWEVAQELGLPVVVKPQFGNHGRGVTTNLTTQEEVTAAYENARLEESTVMCERYLVGDDYRLLVVGNQLVAAALRQPALVFGDGVSTIEQLVVKENQDPRRSDGHSTAMSFIKIDPVAIEVLAQQGFTPKSVPADRQRVLIRRNANLSTGGTAIDVTSLVHPEVAARAVEAARVVGLDIAGIDVITSDISKPLENQQGGIVEVNAGPGLRMHLQPSIGTPQPVGEAIIDTLFPAGDNGRIPLVAVTGVNGKTTTTRLIAHIVALQGKCVGMTNTDGVYVGSRRIDTGDCSGPASAKRILMNPTVDAAVLETARGGIIRAGLAFDQCDVAVVTNIGEGDHLGLNNIHTLEQLAKVKRTIVDVVSPDGFGVLNADDPLVVEMAPKCPGGIVFFAHEAENPHLVSRRAQNGRVVFIKDRAVTFAQGESEFALISLDKVPLTHGGKIRFQVENAMAAAAATWALGVPVQIIRAGLESFSPSLESCPGRFNVIECRGATLVVDYGHNPSALKQVLDAISGFPSKRRIAVYSTAGDRRDGDMIRQGQMLGHFFDSVILYEGAYVRGRRPGDIVQLFREGMAIGARVKDRHSFTAWGDAVQCALNQLSPGDLVLVQADSVDETVTFFRNLAALMAAQTPTPPSVTDIPTGKPC